MVRSRNWTRPAVICLLSIAAGTLLSACNGGSQDPSTASPQSAAPPAQAANTSPQPPSATANTTVPAGPNFTTSGTVDGSELGLVGDGATDNTATFRALLGTGDRTIHISAGVYVTGKLDIPSNTIINLDSGATIKDNGQLGPDDRLINIAGSNVYIKGVGARVISNRSYYTGGEQRHGIFIYGATNVTIDGLESSNNSGDGFYIGGPQGQPSQEIVLENCLASNNRRQGLSITNASSVKVMDCEFEDTNGTAPQFGIDMEPNYPTDYLSNIVILRPLTDANVGGGIQICLTKLDAGSPEPTIDIEDHLSENESPAFYTVGLSNVVNQISYTAVRSSTQNNDPSSAPQ